MNEKKKTFVYINSNYRSITFRMHLNSNKNLHFMKISKF